MSSKKPNQRRGYRHQNVPIENRIRVRSKRLDQVDEDKLSLAFWLLARQLVEDQSDTPANPDEPDDDNDDPGEIAT